MRKVLLLASILLLSCPAKETARLPPGPDDPAKNLAQLDAFADRVQLEATKASWRSATEPQANARPAPFGILPLLLLTDGEVAALNSRLTTDSQRQCLRAIHSLSLHMQSESDHRVAPVLAAIAPWRQQIPDLSTMFTDEADMSRREELWRSQAHVAFALAPLVRQLIAARNRWAWQQSRSPYLEVMKNHRGYDSNEVDALEASVRRGLASPDIPRSPPWAFEFIDPLLAKRFAERFDGSHCLQRAEFVFQYLGLPAKPARLRVSNIEQSAFSSFAFYPIDPPADQGITVRPAGGITPHWSAFHEYGHAAMALLAEPAKSCRTLKRPYSPAVSESCAKITERLFFSAEWQQSQGVPPAEIELLREWERKSELMRMRSILADIEFERAIYRKPEGDLTGQFIAIERRTAGVDVGREFPAWALKRNLAFEPLARVDYLLARCAQAAVYRRLRKLPGGLMGEPARKVMRDQVFRGAAELNFEDWFRKAAGAEPNCSAWLEDVAHASRQ
jgi:hypothetical protein